MWFFKSSFQELAAQREKNLRLKDAFGIGKDFVDGSSFSRNREAVEKAEKEKKSYKMLSSGDDSDDEDERKSKKKKKKNGKDKSKKGKLDLNSPKPSFGFSAGSLTLSKIVIYNSTLFRKGICLV